jgi:hypothetical protein
MSFCTNNSHCMYYVTCICGQAVANPPNTVYTEDSEENTIQRGTQ